MASTFNWSNNAAAAQAGDGTNKGILALLAGGSITFYDGTQPANADATATGNSYGAVTLASPAATESNGQLTLAPTSNGTCAYTGTPTYFRIRASGGGSICDGSCGDTGAGTYDCNIGSAAWVSGAAISGTSLGTITVPAH